MNPEAAAIAFGLASAASWGAGNSSGGLASKRQDAMVVVAISQAFGAVLLVALAGVAGALGLAALYRGPGDG